MTKDADGKDVWCCSIRPKKYAYKNGTRVIKEHLKNAHGKVDIVSIEIDPAMQRNRNIEQMFRLAHQIPAEQQIDFEVGHLDRETFKLLLVPWLASNCMTFRIVDSDAFRQFLHFVNPAAAKMLPLSHKTLCKWSMTVWEQMKQKIKHQLSDSATSIRLTVDAWSSPNSLGVLAVVAHHITQQGQRQHVLIGVREIFGAHSGENFAAIVHTVLKEYDISANLGFIVADNATSNDTLCKELAKMIRQTGSVVWNPDMHRLRCIAHIIQLAVAAFLNRHHEESMKESRESDGNWDLTARGRARWRLCGAIGKLHNIVVYITRTPRRMQKFRNLPNNHQRLSLRRDNATRWNYD